MSCFYVDDPKNVIELEATVAFCFSFFFKILYQIADKAQAVCKGSIFLPNKKRKEKKRKKKAM